MTPRRLGHLQETGRGDRGEAVGVGRRRSDLNSYVVRARQNAREIQSEVEKFSQEISQLQSLAKAATHDPFAQCESLVGLQRSKLELAVEELRAQNAALQDACTALEDERARYADLFDAAPDACLTTDARGVIREANAAAAGLLGMEQRALPGKLIIAFVARRSTREFRSQMAFLLECPTHAFTVQLRPRGGLPFDASFSATRVRRAAGGVPELRWTIRAGSEWLAAGERPLLADVACALRASPAANDAPSSALSLLIGDLEQFRAAAGTGPREDMAPSALVKRALVHASKSAASAVEVGPIGDDAVLSVSPERATWAIARLLALGGGGMVRGRRMGSSYVFELRARSAHEPSSTRLACAAVRTVLAEDGGRLRIMERDDGELAFEVRLPLRTSEQDDVH